MSLLKKMVEIYSPSGEEAEFVNTISEEIKDLGFDVETDSVGNLIASAGEGDLQIFLVGHIDTVPGIIPVRVKDGIIHGRGVVDAKGSFCAFVGSAIPFIGNDRARIFVIGAVGEEADSRGAYNLIDKYDPDYVVIGEPSGSNGITMGYRGSFKIHYQLEKSRTHTGKDEMRPAERAINVFQDLRERFGDHKTGFGNVSIGMTKINTGNDPFKETVEMELDIRFPETEIAREIKNFILSQELEGNFNFSRTIPPIKSSKRNRLVSSFLGSIRERGGKPTFKLKTGTSDMNILGNAWNVPILAYGPGDSSLDHTPGEHLEIEEYKIAVEVLKGSLRRLIEHGGKNAAS